MSIQVNPHGRSLWRMDAGGFCSIAVPSVGPDGKPDGIYLKGKDGIGSSSVLLTTDEAKSLRDWLNTMLEGAE